MSTWSGLKRSRSMWNCSAVAAWTLVLVLALVASTSAECPGLLEAQEISRLFAENSKLYSDRNTIFGKGVGQNFDACHNSARAMFFGLTNKNYDDIRHTGFLGNSEKVAEAQAEHVIVRKFVADCAKQAPSAMYIQAPFNSENLGICAPTHHLVAAFGSADDFCLFESYSYTKDPPPAPKVVEPDYAYSLHYFLGGSKDGLGKKLTAEQQSTVAAARAKYGQGKMTPVSQLIESLEGMMFSSGAPQSAAAAPAAAASQHANVKLPTAEAAKALGQKLSTEMFGCPPTGPLQMGELELACKPVVKSGAKYTGFDFMFQKINKPYPSAHPQTAAAGSAAAAASVMAPAKL